MGDLSDHFSRTEFDCPHCGAGGPTPQLVQILEALRGRVGRPLPIVSGFRCVPHNRSVGGAAKSRHMYSDAADIPSGYATQDDARDAGAKGIGMKGPWVVHVDWRPGAISVWNY